MICYVSTEGVRTEVMLKQWMPGICGIKDFVFNFFGCSYF